MRPRHLTFLLALLLLAVACGGESAPSAVDEGREIYGNTCSACHGAAGEGGVGPALAGVLVTWPSCIDHISWIALGSDGWLQEEGDTYGATAKPVLGGMPAHASTLSADQIAAVAAFERVTYGGASEDAALADCAVGVGS